MSDSTNLLYRHVPQTSTRVRSLVELLELRAENCNGEAAYTFLEDGEGTARTIACQELDSRARAIAARLREDGAFGDRALLLYAPGLDFLPAFFGCLYSNIIAVPAYPPHRNRNLLRLQAIISDARPAFILTTAALQPRIEEALSGLRDACAPRIVATDQVDEEEDGITRGRTLTWKPWLFCNTPRGPREIPRA